MEAKTEAGLHNGTNGSITANENGHFQPEMALSHGLFIDINCTDLGKKFSRLCQRYNEYNSQTLSVCFFKLKTHPLPPEYNLPSGGCWSSKEGKFLQTAETLKPSTPLASHDSIGSSGSKDGAEFYPHIQLFLQNKAGRDDFSPRKLKNMHLVVDKLMAHSHLKYKGTLSMLDCNIFPGLGQDFLSPEVNMFLFPMQEIDGEDNQTKTGLGTYPLFSLFPGYRGHPSFPTMNSKLRSQILAMRRCQLSHTILTEKNWFHYAARIWDGVKKSSALSEYSRLLC
uniref:SMG9 nonsense mediated mRNA decay factor n=1 Tax=Salarias fasciatus TaxID=181472 RepID=A0A672HY20_SALFA